MSLLEYSEELNKLRNDHSLIAHAVEETLRYRSPVQGVIRYATNVKIGGRNIHSGQRMVIWLGSANHDENTFFSPDKFDISRGSDVQHVAFGYGSHFCLGAPLARLEAQVVLKVILERLDGLTLDNRKPLEPLPSTVFHGLKCLPLLFS